MKMDFFNFYIELMPTGPRDYSYIILPSGNPSTL